MQTTTRRFAAMATGVALGASLLATAAPATAAPSPSSTSAGSWLTTQLAGGVVVTGGETNYSLSLDVALGELEGGNPAVATQIRDALAPTMAPYLDSDAGQNGYRTAQALRVVQATGGNPASYGGVNLVSRLEGVVEPSGKVTTSYYVGYNQAIAVEALTTATSPKAASAAGYLLQQQCPGGYFIPLQDTACTDSSAPDTDATAQAVIGLQGRLAEPAVKAAVDKALAWLKARQAADGSFIGSEFVPAANANSTALAVEALGASCDVTAANRGADFLRTLQVPAGTTGALANAVGAVAYDKATLDAARTNGIPADDQFNFRFPTAQAALGLPWDAKATSELKIRGPKGGYVKAGDKVTYKVKGAANGERVCVTTPAGVQALTSTGNALEVVVKTTRKTTDGYTVSATTGPGTATRTATPLAGKALKVRSAKRVERGDRLKVTLRKLAPKERVVLRVDGKVVTKGKANAKGVFVSRIKARFTLGKHTLRAQGAYGNRKAVSRFTVTR